MKKKECKYIEIIPSLQSMSPETQWLDNTHLGDIKAIVEGIMDVKLEALGPNLSKEGKIKAA